MDSRLAAYRDPLGRRRFYPPGHHPATARLVEHRRKLAALPSGPDRDAALDYCDARLSEFEQGEGDAKARMLTVMRDA